MVAVQRRVGETAVQRAGRLAGRAWRSVLSGGTTPGRLRLLMIPTVVLAVLFGVLGAFGIGAREAALRDVRDAADQLIAVHDVQVRLVHADALASENYLRGGPEDATARSTYLEEIDRASTLLVTVANNVPESEAKQLAGVGALVADYSGLVEQARANNRQGFPVGAAYLRVANDVMAQQAVPTLRAIEQALRHQVNDELSNAHRAGAWLHVTGWPLLAVIAGGGAFVAFRFRRLINVPLAFATAGGLVLLLTVGSMQGSAVSDADSAVAGPLQAADLIAQARAAAFDARTDEALTLVNRGNGAAYDAKWEQASATAAAALATSCNDLGTECPLVSSFDGYAAGYAQVRALDSSGEWDSAVGESLGASAERFSAFSDQSAAAAADNGAAASTQLAAAGDALPALRIVVFVSGLVIAALVLVGFGQRLREYR